MGDEGGGRDNGERRCRLKDPTSLSVLCIHCGRFSFQHALPFRYIETDSEWRDVVGRQFASKSEARLHHMSKWIRDQV